MKSFHSVSLHQWGDSTLKVVTNEKGGAVGDVLTIGEVVLDVFLSF